MGLRWTHSWARWLKVMGQVADAQKGERPHCAGPFSVLQVTSDQVHDYPHGLASRAGVPEPTPLLYPPCDPGLLPSTLWAPLPTSEMGLTGNGPWPLGFSSPHSLLRASQPSTMTYESLKRSLQADRLCLLNHHLSLHLRRPHSSPQASATAPGGPWPQGLKAGEAEAWEEPASLLGLPGTLVDVRDPRLEGALHLLLAQQLRARGRVGGARLRGLRTPGRTPPSPSAGSDSEVPQGPEGKAAGAALLRGQHTQPTAPGSPRRKDAIAPQDYVPDKPLDLSERGRGRDASKPTGQLGSLSPTAHTPSPTLPQGAEPPVQSGPQGLSNGTKEPRAPDPGEHPTPLVRARPSSWPP